MHSKKDRQFGSQAMYYGASQWLITRAKDLRRHTTVEENIFWKSLKNRNLLGLRFRRQHPIENFIVDFYCHEIKLVIELDGPIHNHPNRKESDDQRHARLKELGITVVRYRNAQIHTRLPEILQHLKETILKIQSQP